MTISSFLILSCLLFSIGLYGLLTRKSALQMYLALEIMFNAVNLNFLAFAYFSGTLVNLKGQVFVLFIITVAAIEAAVGLSIILALYRYNHSTEIDRFNQLKH